MDVIDLKYAGFLSMRLERFSVKSHTPYKSNFRCPICGDSQKSKKKARGWLLEREDGLMFYCHNGCGGKTFRNFLKAVDENLYSDYVVDKKLGDQEETELFDAPKDPPSREVKLGKNPLSGMKKISQLKHDHPAKKYVEKRKIPSKQHYRLYYCKDFNAWVNSIIPDKLSKKVKEPRLVMPFFDKNGKLIGFSGRSFDPKAEMRYITIMLTDDHKVFGMDKLDAEERYYIVEGQIDSLFLDNSIAMAGSDGHLTFLEHPENAVFIFDNEPRNLQIIKKMKRLIEAGYKVCIWPEWLVQKDINDMVMAGMSTGDVKRMIDSHIPHNQLEAELELSKWRKV